MLPLFIMHKSRNLSEKKRRDQFNVLINELCAMVTSSGRKMDKSSVLRSTISFLKNHSELSVQSQSVKVPENWKPSFLSNEEFTHLMLEALDGFIIVFSCNGQILYTSESTASLLGYLPSRIYSSVFDIVHETDKSSLYQLISSPPTSVSTAVSKDSFVSLSLHMKRGPIHPQGSSSYEQVQLLGSFYHWPAATPSSCEGVTPQGSFDCDSNSCSSMSTCSGVQPPPAELRSCFVAVGRLQVPHLLRAAHLPDDAKNEFTSRHSLEWKFLFLDHRAPPIIGYLPFEVLGTSGYDYYHVDDLDNITSSHELLMSTGEGTSCYYRFLTKGQQWIWLQTRYYISYHQWNSKPEFIVCTHTVVSTEKVLRSNQEKPKCSPHKPSKAATLCSSPPHSTCLSPSPSVSSLGSLSSEPSEQCAPKVSSTTRAPAVQSRPYPQLLPQDPFLGAHQDMQGPTHGQPPEVSAPLIMNGPPSMQQYHPEQQQQPATMQQQQQQSATMQQQQQHHPPAPVQQLDPDYLRHRHRLLQQQILAQQEELRRVSEQLMMAEYSGAIFHDAMGQGAAGEYVEPPSFQRVAASSEMAFSEGHRTYLNLEPSMCTLSTEQINQLSAEILPHGYSLHMPPPSS